MKEINTNLLKRSLTILGMAVVSVIFTANATVVKPDFVEIARLPVVEDTYIQSTRPDDIFGSNSVLYLNEKGQYAGANDIERSISYMKFDISSLTSEVEIAFINCSFDTMRTDYAFDLYKCSNDWSEATTCWNNMNVSDSLPFYYGISESDFLAVEGDRFLGTWFTKIRYSNDSLFHKFDITDYLNECIAANEDFISIGFTNSALSIFTSSNNSNNIKTRESDNAEFGSFISVVEVDPAPYFNDFSEDTQSDWLNASDEFATVDSGRISEDFIFGNYYYQQFTYYPSDLNPWIYTPEYPIFAFKAYFNDADGEFGDFYPNGNAYNYKFNNRANRAPDREYINDTVLYWDFTSGRLDEGFVPEIGPNFNMRIKMTAGLEMLTFTSIVLDWVGTFRNTAELEEFIGVTDNAYLSDIMLDNHSMSVFDVDRYEYDIIVDAVPNAKVSLFRTSENASVRIYNATSLPGTTTIIVTAADGLSSHTYTINFTSSSLPTSIEEVKSDIIISAGKGMVTLLDLAGNENVTVFDMSGRQMTSVNATSSQLEINLASGVYIVKVTGSQSSTQKVFVQ